MAAAMPIVASDGGALPELIDDGVTGYIAPVGDVDTMAAKAIACLSDSNLQKQIGANALKKVKENYLPKMIVDQYETLYSSLL